MLAATCYYYFYEWVHHLVHVKRYEKGFMAYLQDLHLDHHRRNWGNYGQTTPLWDIAFGTYVPSNQWKRKS
jgi:sterol desaturase/sphingolipid hydroxylase (fatty acid hydroxylase superfamily)